MGVLEDAIREHLELKRRHGVAEEEVLRQETEALGPARREPEEPHEEEHEAHEPEAATRVVAPDDATAVLLGEDRAPSVERDKEPKAGDEIPTEEHDLEEPDEVPAEESLGEAPRTESKESVREEEQPGQEREDVPDDIPDFLKEPREGDRLGQRSPRDFDFE